MKTLTPGQIAEAAGVSVSSVKRWVDRGFIDSTRTPGGHRRILATEVIRFLREQHMPLVRPAALHLGDELSGAEHSGTDLYDYLLAGNLVRAHETLISAFSNGFSVAAIWDGPVSYALRQLGRAWSERDDGVFLEHRATAACIETVVAIGGLLPHPDFSAPIAVGCSPEHDPYIIPNLMARTVLLELGYDAINLGPNTPATTLDVAIQVHTPRLVWIALNGRLGRKENTQLNALFDMLRDTVAHVVIGGRTAARLERVPPHVTRLNSMSELRAFARALPLRLEFGEADRLARR